MISGDSVNNHAFWTGIDYTDSCGALYTSIVPNEIVDAFDIYFKNEPHTYC